MIAVLKALIGGFLASLGFGVLYNIQERQTLLLAGLTGAIGTVTYQLVMTLGGTELSASFYGAITFSLLAQLLAKIRRTPSIMYSVPALIPLVPGGTVFKMMSELLTGKTYNGLNLGMHALAISGMLVFGMTLTATCLALVKKTSKTVKSGAQILKKEVVTIFHDETPPQIPGYFHSGKTARTRIKKGRGKRNANSREK